MLIVEFLALITVSESGSATANNVIFGQRPSGFRLAAAIIEFREATLTEREYGGDENGRACVELAE
jgi:hypothetical protein